MRWPHTLAPILEGRNQRAEAERSERFSAELGDIAAACDLGRMLLQRGEREDAIVWLRRSAVGG